MLATIRELYEGQSERANRFRQELLVFDLATQHGIRGPDLGCRGAVQDTDSGHADCS